MEREKQEIRDAILWEALKDGGSKKKYQFFGKKYHITRSAIEKVIQRIREKQS
jgi:Mor family transcriptional regulator